MTHSPARHYICGHWIGDGPLADSVNPATLAPIGQYHPGSAALADSAAKAARDAFFSTDWAYAPRLRAQALLEIADRIEAAKDEIADLVVAENGKIRAEAIGETMAAISETRYYAGLARDIRGSMQEIMPGSLSLFHREAAGVAGIIVPWNAPVTLLMRSLAPALAAGCTAVIKPAHQTPLVHARIMEAISQAPSLPKGVVNSVNENGIDVGRAMTASPDIDVISFTGSSQTGQAIMAAAAPTLKRVGLELGGKAPAVIFEDADLDLAARELTHGALAMAGQICVAAARFLVHESVAKEFETRVSAAFKSVRVGPGDKPESQMGSLIDLDNRARIERLIEQAGDEGELVLKGAALSEAAFLTPTLFRIDDVNSPLVQEELFGPIVSIETFADEQEAVAKANATAYGLAASVFTADHHRALRMARAIRAGTVWLNSHLKLFAEAETGGYGKSGLGRLHGPEGLYDFLETKHIYSEPGRVGGMA
ncbi:aldehyde dehydrogenase family protein [Marivita geojedonensis]|uniref:aldehyde dehydrogenase (NAD(+)) n=1 Tax=Marivita geojedonensis TaxID=1123756 RepID=A0A1X4NNC4_9RHOB|nr:aldehyde dehydrogenase family protein [Marivita geojedonensis]OSQ51943.1 aldehyde dehydrogenase [Marivita geojedonensis]PRY81322.1 acyl-CoA reductase-like NAD-dependent aldehyde dehydrogenase [Marivita geojedonensis]